MTWFEKLVRDISPVWLARSLGLLEPHWHDRIEAAIAVGEPGNVERPIEVYVHHGEGFLTVQFRTAHRIEPGETVCLTFPPHDTLSGRWNWYGEA